MPNLKSVHKKTTDCRLRAERDCRKRAGVQVSLFTSVQFTARLCQITRSQYDKNANSSDKGEAKVPLPPVAALVVLAIIILTFLSQKFVFLN